MVYYVYSFYQLNLRVQKLYDDFEYRLVESFKRVYTQGAVSQQVEGIFRFLKLILTISITKLSNNMTII